MALSSPTVFVIVEDDYLPMMIGNFGVDAVGQAVARPGADIYLAIEPLVGGPGDDIEAAWDDAPTNETPILEWDASNIQNVGIWRWRWLSDKDGPERWSAPTEDPNTLIVVTKTGA